VQGERRASLTNSVQLDERLRRSRKWIFILALLVLAFDQATKWWAVAYLEGRADINVIGEFLRFNHTTNSGAAFNIGSNFTIFLTVFALIVTAGVVVYARKVVEMRWALGFGVLLGGVLGNLTDRIFRAPQFLHGHVVDFIQLPNWPIFNIADIAITLSGFWIAYLLIRDVQPFATFGDFDPDADRTEENRR
jgi:signal peptidase II